MKHSEYGSVFSTAVAENSEIKIVPQNKFKVSRMYITQVVLIRSALLQLYLSRGTNVHQFSAREKRLNYGFNHD